VDASVDGQAPTEVPTDSHATVASGGANQYVGSVPKKINRFGVLDKLGEGGMGVVYSAFDPELERRVAIKILRGSDSGGVERLRREARAMARLSHPNVAQLYEVGSWNGQLYLAMEFVKGATVREWLKMRERTETEILRVFEQAGRGLAAAHDAKLIHRDFKPDNVMVGMDGRVRVLDFGIAGLEQNHLFQPASSAPSHTRVPNNGQTRTDQTQTVLTKTGSLLGTPAYMSPEQFLGGKVSPACDQYSFCVALYEALYGERPFSGATIANLTMNVVRGNLRPAPEGRPVSEPVRTALLRGFSVKPDSRFSNMADLLSALGATDPLSTRRWKPAVLAAAGVVVFGVIAGAVYDRQSQLEADLELKEQEVVVAKSAALLSEKEARNQRIVSAAYRIRDSPTEAAVLLRELPDLGPAAPWRRAADEAYANRHVLSAAFVVPSDPTLSLAYSEDGQFLLSVSEDGGVRAFDTFNLRQDPIVLRSPGGVTRRGASFGGKWMWPEGGVLIWDTSGSIVLQGLKSAEPPTIEFNGPNSPVTDAGVSNDGEWIAAGFADGAVWAWHSRIDGTGREIYRFKSPVADLEFDCCEGIIATSVSGRAAVTSVSPDQPRHGLRADGNIRFAHFGAGTNQVLTGTAEGKVSIWERETGSQTASFELHDAELLDATFINEATQILTVSRTKGLSVFDLASRRAVSTRPVQEPIGEVRFGAGGQTILASGDGQAVRIWDVKDLSRERRVKIGPHESAAVALSSNQKMATATYGLVQTWNLHSSAGPQTLEGHEGTVDFIGYGDRGRDVLTVATGGLARVWRGDPLELVRTFGARGQPIRHALVLPDRRGFVTVSGDSRVILAPWDEKEEVRVINSTGGRVTAVAADDTGFRFATAHDDGSVVLRRLTAPEQPTRIVPHRSQVRSLAISPNGRFVVSGGSDGTLAWSLPDGDHSTTQLLAHDGEVVALAFSPDGKMFASASADGVVKVWLTGKEPEELLRHEEGAATNQLRFSDDHYSRYLLGVGEDDCLRVWDTGAAKTKASGPGWRRWCARTGWSPAASASRNGTVRFAEFTNRGDTLYIATASEVVRTLSRFGSSRDLLPNHVGGVTAMAAFDGTRSRFVTAAADGTVRSWEDRNVTAAMWSIEYCTPPPLRQAQLGETVAIARHNFEACLNVVEACRLGSDVECLTAAENSRR
jgi:WD40 repeat protein